MIHSDREKEIEEEKKKLNGESCLYGVLTLTVVLVIVCLCEQQNTVDGTFYEEWKKKAN